jgi:hypothetical protein
MEARSGAARCRICRALDLAGMLELNRHADLAAVMRRWQVANFC